MLNFKHSQSARVIYTPDKNFVYSILLLHLLDLPYEIRERDEFVREYWKACEEGSTELKYFRLMIVGSEGVGKTCLLKALKGQLFDENEISTDFIEKTDITTTNLNKEWGKSVNFKEQLQTIRNDSAEKIAIKNVRESSKSSDAFKRDSPKEDDRSIKTNLTASEEIISDYLNSPVKQASPVIHPELISKFDLNTITQRVSPPDLPLLKEIGKHWKSQDTMKPLELSTVWDLAGQSYLFCMHSLFLSPRAVYIVAVDLTKRLDEQIVISKERKDRIQKRDISLSYLEMINYWIQTIYSVAMSTEDQVCKSRIIIVFTKSDKIGNPQEKADSYFKEIKKSLFWKSNCMLIVDKKFHIVSAKDRKQEEMKMLKKAINENAKLTRFDSDLPIRWLDLALKILGDFNPVMGERELKDIADRTGCGMDYAQILEFFHSIGVFFFRKNILVKSLSGLLNIILHIVLPTFCKDLEYFPRINQHIERAEKEAILSDEILDAILKHNNLLLVKTEIVQLLKEFGIIIHRNSEEYYIPYLFNEVIPIDPKDSDLILYLYFTDGLMPTSFYFAFLSLCINKCDQTENSPKLGFDCVEFQWQNLTWIIDLPDHKPFIRIIVRGIDFMNSCPDIHSQILQLEEWTAHIQRELILSGKIAQVILECPCKQFSEKLIPCAYLNDYPKDPFKTPLFHCKNKKKFISWAIYNNKLSHPFKNIPHVLGEKFVKVHRDQILEMLEVEPLLRALQKKGLISGDVTTKIRKLNKSEKAGFLVDNISNRRNDWAYQFYKILKKDENQSNVEVRKLYESFILGFNHSEIPVEEISSTSYPIHNNPCGICLIINIRTFRGKKSERKGSEIDVSNLQKTFDNMSFKTVVFQDFSGSDLRRELKTLSAMDHKDYDVFFCVIMSHGNEKNEIYTTDDEVININDIQDYFTPKELP